MSQVDGKIVSGEANVYELTGIMATTHTNRRNERFTLEALQGAAEQANATGGRPHLINHDWSRPLGWGEQFWLAPMDDGEHALHFLVSVPETQEEEEALSLRFKRYLSNLQHKEIWPYRERIQEVGRPEAAAVFVFDCVGLVETNLAHVLCEQLSLPDEDQLVPIARLEPIARGLFKAGDYVLAPHWMMRRFSFRLNSINDALIGNLKRLDDQTALSCRVRLDADFVGLADSLESVGECDYWWGPPFQGDIGSQPEGVLCHGANERIQFHELLDRAEMYIYRRGTETVVQIEEVHSPPIIRTFMSNTYALERYAHMIVDEMGSVIHLDGAMRLYSEEEWEERRSSNLPRAPRASHRLKMFAVDGITDQETAIGVLFSYFRGNPLVPEMFGVEMSLDAA